MEAGVMAGAPVLLGVGATKAGTSWLYRALADHPGCALRAVKELHYWDTFAPDRQAEQARVFEAKLAEFRAGAAQADRPVRAKSQARQARDMAGLLAVIEGDRAGDAAYRAYLTAEANGRLAADITPAYALLPDDIFGRMIRALPGARVLYLVRDPVARLWSHLRMKADRAPGPEPVEARAAKLLRGLLRHGRHPDVTERGDYPGAVARLRRLVAPERLRVEFCEALWTPPGWASLQAWLRLAPNDPPGRAVHEGPRAPIPADLAVEARKMLRPHYDWAAQALGPLPRQWRETMETA